MAIIISDNTPEIKDKILHDLDRGLTSLKGHGGFSENDKEILLCIISRAEVSKLKKEVYDIDREAFVVISNVQEVLGEGFKEVIGEE